MSDPILDDWANFLHAFRRVIGTEDGEVISKIEIDSVVIARQDQSTFYGKGVTKMQMTDTEKCTAHVSATTSEGNPATLADVPVWNSDDPTVVTVEPSPDGMTCVIKSPSPGPLGSAVVTVSAKIGTETVESTLAVDIVAGDATKLEITTDAPTPA
jgi:hypothetical protein